MYNRNYFRATWVTTALDAGFWTAMWLKPKWFKDIASVVFSVYYLICAEQADEYVKKVRGKMSIEHMRVSWNKPTTPYLQTLTALLRPPQYRMKRGRPRRCQIPRRPGGPNRDKIMGWMYFDGSLKELKEHDKLILDVPGGGFVAMDPRCHDDKLMAWSRKTGLPVLSLDYGKAPEHPYPYALHECYDAYWMIVKSKGLCLGMKEAVPKIVLTGDSAGGNLATGLTLMIARSHTTYFPGDSSSQEWLPMPEALLLIYPALDVNITSWLTEEQAALINDPEMRKVNRTAFKRNTEDYRKLTNTPHPSDDELDAGLRMTSTSPKEASTILQDAPVTGSPVSADPPKGFSSPRRAANGTLKGSAKKQQSTQPKHMHTRLQLTSMISYFNDRILSPEMLRGMIMLYIPPDMRPDFSTDIYLSPLRAPEDMLAKFPKVYMLCGDKDPLTDDTLIFAGRLKQAHKQVFQGRKELGMIKEKEVFNFKDHVEQWMIPGVSHGFLQFVSVYHDGWKYIDQCVKWIETAFADSAARELASASGPPSPVDYFTTNHWHQKPRRQSSITAESSDNEDRPLEIGKLTTIAEGSGSSQSSGKRRATGGRGSIRKRERDSGRRSPVAMRKHPSLVRLSSSEDLIGRRMHGLTSGLVGEQGRVETP